MKRPILKKLGIIAALTFCGLSLVACQPSKENANQIRLGTISGPETTLMRTAQKVALEQSGLHVKLVQFTDYTMPNIALADGSIDANAFQDVPYLDAAIKAHHYKLTVIGKTFIYPMGLYSSKIKTLADVPEHAIVAIPNDPSNEARGLLLLQAAGLITLKPGIDTTATTLDIATNPKQLKIKALDAAELPRVLQDVTLAAINTNYAIPAGLSPKTALYSESANSPYANIVVVRTKDANEPKFKELMRAINSKAVLDEAHKLFGDAAIPAWQINIAKPTTSV